MRPDMEDYAEIDEARPNGSRAMSWMVLAVAVGGFAALAYYAYHSGTKAPMDGETMTVEADQAPIKEAPANPEGEQFPDKDKTIYDVISPNGAQKTSEKLMPDPEHPVAATNVEDSEDDAPTGVATPAPAPVSTATVPANGTASTFVAKGTDSMGNTTSGTPQTVSEVPVATTAKPVNPAATVATPATTTAKSYSAPEMVNAKTIGKKETPAAKPAAKPVTAAAKPAAAQAAKGGSYQVQLGAFKSESDAQAAWKKLSGAHSDVLSGSPNIVKADVNGATWYRLRAGSYATNTDAKAVCAKIGAQCMSVK